LPTVTVPKFGLQLTLVPAFLLLVREVLFLTFLFCCIYAAGTVEESRMYTRSLRVEMIVILSLSSDVTSDLIAGAT